MKAEIPTGSNFIVRGLFYLHVSCEKAMPERDRIYFEERGSESPIMFTKVYEIVRFSRHRAGIGSIICEHIICIEALSRSIKGVWMRRTA